MLSFARDAKKNICREMECLVKERISIYRQHIRQPQYQQLTVEEDLSTFGDGKFHMFPFSKIFPQNK